MGGIERGTQKALSHCHMAAHRGLRTSRCRCFSRRMNRHSAYSRHAKGNPSGSSRRCASAALAARGFAWRYFLCRCRFRSLRCLCLRIFLRRFLMTLPNGLSPRSRSTRHQVNRVLPWSAGLGVETRFGSVKRGFARDQPHTTARPLGRLYAAARPNRPSRIMLRAPPSARLIAWRRGRKRRIGVRRRPSPLISC
jgi:hypothetical protein